LNKKCLITGSSGFIGKVLINKLQLLGYDVTGLDLLDGIDISDWQQLKDIKSFDTVIHLAAKTFVPESYKNPREFYHNNYSSVLNLLELCRINKAKMIFASSYVYGIPDYLPIDENHPLKPFNPYAHSKIIGEELCRGYYKEFCVPVTIFRPFNVYGPGQNKNFLISSIIDQAINGKILLKDPLPQRDFLYIDDMADAYIKCLEYNDAGFDIFNIGYGKSYSVSEIVDMIKSILGTEINVEYTGEKRKNEVSETVANIKKAERIFGWHPQVSFEAGLKLMLKSSNGI